MWQSCAAALDFIALDGRSNYGEADGLSDEELDFQGRTALIWEKSDVKKGVLEVVVVDVSKMTVRKGLGKRMDAEVVGIGVSVSSVLTMVQSF
ncbi:hypothetical protein HanIR_Chr01g0033981 [Helianthus annuus]|nr:hypothetical protein HanIR_Chr01g0033981 [Helianthus annuus]